MENEKIIEKLNTAANILDSLRNSLLKEEKKSNKSKTSKTLKDLAADIKDLDVGTTEEPTTKKPKDISDLNKQLQIKHLLQKYSCFNEVANEREFLEDIAKIIVNNDISFESLDSALERIKYANDKQHKEDIKKYTYSCLYNINKNKS